MRSTLLELTRSKALSAPCAARGRQTGRRAASAAARDPP